VQRRNGAIDQAADSYERAIELFKQAGASPGREAGVTLALGHIEGSHPRARSRESQCGLAADTRCSPCYQGDLAIELSCHDCLRAYPLTF